MADFDEIKETYANTNGTLDGLDKVTRSRYTVDGKWRVLSTLCTYALVLRQDYDMDEDSDEVDGTIPDDYNALLLSLLLLLPTFVLVYYLFDCVTS